MKQKEKELFNKLYAVLAQRYDVGRWWPAQTPFEVAIGSVLTQNTNWNNVVSAMANFSTCPDVHDLLAMDTETLQAHIRPAGFYRQKTATLQRLSHWWLSADLDQATPKLREELLIIKGIGKETADSILLYAFDRPVVVVDAYTKRLYMRLGVSLPRDYDDIQSLLKKMLPLETDILQSFHGQLVEFSKEYCRKKPLCVDCPAAGFCKKMGIKGKENI